MNAERRNPYLALGIPYGTDREQATSAFARRSRRARREPSFPYQIDDLTWALNQIEAHIENPTADVSTYRIPADPEVLKPPPGPGALRLAPVPLERRSPPSTTEDRERLEQLAIREAIVDMLTKTAPEVATRHGVGRATPTLAITGEPRASHRRRYLLIITVAVVLAAAATIGAFAITNSSNSRAPATTGAPPATATTSPPTNPPPPVTDPPPTTVLRESAQFGPITTYAPDGFNMDQWTSITYDGNLLQDECFALVQLPTDATAAVVEFQSCSEPHRFQVSSVYSIPAEITGYGDVVEAAYAGCRWIFSSFVGVPFDSSAFMVDFIYPAEDRWPLDRIVTCYIHLADQQEWSGTAAGSRL